MRHGHRDHSFKHLHVPGLTLGECLGRGHFSHVYKGTYHHRTVAIKIIERGSERSVDNEVHILNQLHDCPHIVELIEVKEIDQTNMLIFECVDAISEETFFREITIRRMRIILRGVLKALEAAHARNIIHRDVKLGNIMIYQDFSDIRLIDWGCGTCVSPSMLSSAGSRSCRSPEMLLGYHNYGTAGDIWAVGAFILSVMCDGNLPWQARTTSEALSLLAQYVGTDELLYICNRYDLPVPESVREGSRRPLFRLEDAFSDDFKNLQKPKLINLMKRLLTVDPIQRPTAEEALNDVFFDESAH